MTGRGGGEGRATKREGGGGGGQVKFYPYEKGDRKGFRHAEGGGGGAHKVLR